MIHIAPNQDRWFYLDDVSFSKPIFFYLPKSPSLSWQHYTNLELVLFLSYSCLLSHPRKSSCPNIGSWIYSFMAIRVRLCTSLAQGLIYTYWPNHQGNFHVLLHAYLSFDLFLSWGISVAVFILEGQSIFFRNCSLLCRRCSCLWRESRAEGSPFHSKYSSKIIKNYKITNKNIFGTIFDL